jgi:hypothetical protein
LVAGIVIERNGTRGSAAFPLHIKQQVSLFVEDLLCMNRLDIFIAAEPPPIVKALRIADIVTTPHRLALVLNDSKQVVSKLA